MHSHRFQPGRYVMFICRAGVKRYFNGCFDSAGFPRETFHVNHAKTFMSAAHGYKYGSEHTSLQRWQVGRA